MGGLQDLQDISEPAGSTYSAPTGLSREQSFVCIFLWINMSHTAKIVGLIWLGIGIIALAIQTKGFRKLPPEMELE